MHDDPRPANDSEYPAGQKAAPVGIALALADGDEEGEGEPLGEPEADTVGLDEMKVFVAVADRAAETVADEDRDAREEAEAEGVDGSDAVAFAEVVAVAVGAADLVAEGELVAVEVRTGHGVENWASEYAPEESTLLNDPARYRYPV